MTTYQRLGSSVLQKQDLLKTRPLLYSHEMEANAYYFDHPDWASDYFEHCHRSTAFRDRWKAAIGSLDNKVVVDIGCGPGNVFATLGGVPDVLIGVDISEGALEMAKQIGYETLLADAHQLPFSSEIADLVLLNGTLHHCENMQKVLIEAARLVKPGGLLVTDHDPQHDSLELKGLGKLIWDPSGYGQVFPKTCRQKYWAKKSGLSQSPSRYVSATFFKNILEPLAFEVKTFAHNHQEGAKVMEGKTGRSPLKYTLAQLLSGMNPYSKDAALSLMCVARKTPELGDVDTF